MNSFNFKCLGYPEIVQLNPYIRIVEELAERWGRADTEATMGNWSRYVKPHILALVGFDIKALPVDERLKTSSAYDVVYQRILGIYEKYAGTGAK